MTRCKTCDQYFNDSEINQSNECPECAKKGQADYEGAANSIKEVWAQKNKVKILK
jgi:Zn finger protein HypA/HybF involved in hydrogenase expression